MKSLSKRRYEKEARSQWAHAGKLSALHIATPAAPRKNWVAFQEKNNENYPLENIFLEMDMVNSVSIRKGRREERVPAFATSWAAPNRFYVLCKWMQMFRAE